MKTRYVPLALLVTLCAGLALALGQTPVAKVDSRTFVASVIGDWLYVRNASPKSEPPPLKFGQAVDENDCLYGQTGAVVVQQGEQLLSYTCDASQQVKACPILPGNPKPTTVCTVRIGTNPVKAGERASSRWYGAIASLLQQDPDKYMIAASRGLEADLDDAVVPLVGSQLDLSPVFKDMDDGEYWMVLAPVAGGKSSRPLRLRYQRGMPAFVPAAGISPTLYNVISVDQGGSPLGNEAWALIRSPDTYAAASSDFAQLVAASEKWPAEMDPSATRAILRAYLDRLAGTQK